MSAENSTANEAQEAARLRVVELPTEHEGEYMHTPFVLVFDRLTESQARLIGGDVTKGIKAATEARAVLAFTFPVELE